jgi:hypothetical protein
MRALAVSAGNVYVTSFNLNCKFFYDPFHGNPDQNTRWISIQISQTLKNIIVFPDALGSDPNMRCKAASHSNSEMSVQFALW